MTNAIDMSVVDELLSLSEGGDPELLVDLIQMYLDDGPAKLAEIVEGLETQDYDRVERAAHSLKGAAGNLGAVLVQADCERLQLASKQRAREELQSCVVTLRKHYEAAETAMQKLLNQYS